MTHLDDLDRQLLAWLDDPSTPPAPRYLGDVLERTRRTRQRPSWASLERWLPMTVITRASTASPLGWAWILLVVGLVLALGVGAALVGTSLLRSTDPERVAPAVFPIPAGPGAIFAYGSTPVLSADRGIHTVRADGGEMRQLSGDGILATHATWSPDGTRIAYRLWDNIADSIIVMDADGTDPITLASDRQSGDYCVGNFMSLAWSPDGTSLIFPTRDGCSGAFDLNIVPTDGSSPPTRLVVPERHSVFGYWSPDGQRIAYLGSDATGSGTTGLYVADVGTEAALAGGLDGRLVRPDLGPNLLALAADPPLGSVESLAWSPDGARIAVTDGMDVDDETIVIVQADGSGDRALAKGYAAQWAPDGTRLAFHRMVDPSEFFDGRPCTVRTWVIGADGSDERQLDALEDGCANPPLWSPDGTRLAVQLVTSTPEQPTTDFHLGIVTVDETTEPVVLPDYWGGSWQPVAAPLPPAPSSADTEASPTSTASTSASSALEGTWVAETTCEQQNAALAKAGFSEVDLGSAGWDAATCGAMMHGRRIELLFGGDDLVVYQDDVEGWRGRYRVVDDHTLEAGDASNLYITYEYALDGDELSIDMVRDDYPVASDEELAGELVAVTVIYESAPFLRSQVGPLPYALALPEGWVSDVPDSFASADGRMTLALGTGHPAPGQTVEDGVRITRMGEFLNCATDPSQDRVARFGDEQGIVWSFDCGAESGLAANTIHDGLSYRLTLWGPSDEAAELEPLMTEILAGFTFTD